MPIAIVHLARCEKRERFLHKEKDTSLLSTSPRNHLASVRQAPLEAPGLSKVTPLERPCAVRSGYLVLILSQASALA